MNAMAPCPPDSALMKAWETYQATDDFKNSYNWATATIEYAVLPEPSDPTANRFTAENYRQAALGSLWASFMQGWQAAGGADPFAASPPAPALDPACMQAIATKERRRAGRVQSETDGRITNCYFDKTRTSRL